MDRVLERLPLKDLSGQLRLAIVGAYKKETLLEDLLAFGRDLLYYLSNHFFGLFSYLGRFLFSGFKLTEGFKSWLARRFMRRQGQLTFPLTHFTLVGISLSLLVLTTGLGGFIFKKTEPEAANLSASILADDAEFITEESEIGSTKGTTHEVREGESVYSIAQFYSRTVDDLVSANPEDIKESSDKDGAIIYQVKVGTVLSVPPIVGRDYVVEAGDTVESIARYFKSNAQQIVELNYIMSTADLYKYVSANQELFPGGKIIVPLPRTYTAGSFEIPSGTCREVALGYPTDGGTADVIGDYTWGHRGVDFGGAYGEPLYAVADGRVSEVSNLSPPCLR